MLCSSITNPKLAKTVKHKTSLRLLDRSTIGPILLHIRLYTEFELIVEAYQSHQCIHKPN